MSVIALVPTETLDPAPTAPHPPTPVLTHLAGRPSTVGLLQRPRPQAPVPPTVRADLSVQYRTGGDERRVVELRPWGDKLQLMAHARGPRDHDSETRLLPMTHDSKRAPVVQTLRALAALYFGPTGLLPRILGEPDWHEATLLLQQDNDGGLQDLLKVQLRVEGHTGLRALVRHAQPDAAQSGAVTLVVRPGDADPLHALLRVAFGTTPWQMPA